MLKKIILMAAIVGLSGGGLRAQVDQNEARNKSPEEMAELKTKKLNDRLVLSQEQITRVQPIFMEEITRKQEVKARYPQLKTAKEEMKLVRKKSRSEINQILTPEQQKKQKALKKSSSHKTQGHSKKGTEHMDSMKKELDLTTDQVTEINVVLTQTKKEMSAIQDKYPEVKMAKKELRQIKEETNQQLKMVLTPEQFQKLEMRTKKGNGKRK